MNIQVTRAAEGLGRRAFTIAGMERMVEAGVLAADERVELIGGELVPMSAKGARHAEVTGADVLLAVEVTDPRSISTSIASRRSMPPSACASCGSSTPGDV